MSQIFDRQYEFSITSVDGVARSITELRVDFEITKSIMSFPNTARITLYNASDETRALLEQKYTRIAFSAGYRGNMGLLFQGEVRNLFSSRERETSSLTVYAGDGQFSWENSKFNKTFSASVSAAAAIEEVVRSFDGVSAGQLEDLPQGADKLRGQTLNGPSRDILDGFAEEYGFDWSIQNGELNILPRGQVLETDEAVRISAQTGMIGTPVITEIGADVTTALDPRVYPGVPVSIESSSAEIALSNLYFRDVKRTSAEGIYKTMEVTFQGDSRGNDWISVIKGGRLDIV